MNDLYVDPLYVTDGYVDEELLYVDVGYVLDGYVEIL